MRTPAKKNKNRGGRRKGAGRKSAGTVRLEVRPKAETAELMRALADRRGLTLGELLDEAF